MSFFLSLFAVAVAAASVTGAFLVLGRFDRETDRVVAAKQADVKVQMDSLEDTYRRITLGLGFNVMILPKDQELSDLYADNFASNYMPEAYCAKLAGSGIISIQHLLPSLQQKVFWPEKKRTIILMGVRGEVPMLLKSAKKPLLEAVAPGAIVLGHELAQSLKLRSGDRVTLRGRDFTIEKCHEQRGTHDDITAWIDLATAQEMLGKKGLINAMLAIECRCVADGAGVSNLGTIRKDIERVLPQTQVIEFHSAVVARAEARHKAAQLAKESLAAEQHHRAVLRSQRIRVFAVVLPVILIACAVFAGLISLTNVRARRRELGILRVLGAGTRQIVWVVVGRAALSGIGGAMIGVAGAIPWAVAGESAGILDIRLIGLIVLGGPVVSATAAWIPAIGAANNDPADTVRKG